MTTKNMTTKSSRVKKRTSIYRKFCAMLTDICFFPVLQLDKVFSKTDNIFLEALGLPLYIIALVVPAVAIIGIPLGFLSLFGIRFLAWLYNINIVTKVITICLIVYIFSLMYVSIVKGDDTCR